MRCTLPPGSTSNIVIPLLEDISGLTYGDDFGVCYNPEFLREASALEDFLNPKLVVIGAEEPYSLSTLEEVYAAGLPQGIRSVKTDFKTAEMIKFTSNLFNATKISFTNEMWLACRRLGIDGDEVMSTVVEACEGFWNPGYGSRGGYPYGGACLPKDTAAFYTFARSLGLSMELLNSVIAINDRMAELIHWESPMSQQRGLNFDPASVHGYRPAIAPQQAGRTR
jgi:UDPglucose 6-dehydrogenase